MTVIARLSRKRLQELRSDIRYGMVATILDSLESSSLSLPVQVTVYSGVLLMLLLVWKGVKLMRGDAVGRDSASSHLWHHIDILSHSAYCSVCEGLVVDGLFCGSCGICADSSCQRQADSSLTCKLLSQPSLRSDRGNEPHAFLHHWIRGNLPLGSMCCVCGEECVDTGALVDYRCCWCQRTVHEEQCHQFVADCECDFGKWAPVIVPPFAIRVKKVWSQGRRQLVFDSLTDFPLRSDWSPVLVIANRKSGDNEGDKILRLFRLVLNPVQVIDLDTTDITNGFQWCRLLNRFHPKTKVRVLVAGGDGTVGWVLNTIDKLQLQPAPEVGILPLGTGNDLSRVLGWGEVFSCDTPIDEVFERIVRARPVPLDRWKIRVKPDRLLPLSGREVLMNNYFSVGVDALVTLNFHETRASRLYQWLGNRIVNKVLYSFFGTKDFLEGGQCSSLNERIVLEMDGRRVDLPELESIVVLNIGSWAAGADLWNANLSSSRQDADGCFWPPQSIHDQKLEVVGLYSSLHIGQLMIGLSEPLRLGQASSVKLKLKESLPIQADGEPWLQFPATIEIFFHSQAVMLTTAK